MPYVLLLALFIKKLNDIEVLQNLRIPVSDELLRSHAARIVAKHTKSPWMRRYDTGPKKQ